ncbi:TetR family transcriptional regulator [Pseudonocardia sp. CNS-139]|nr:TetR family transcriptional regulator [Pseudonocardia sp. CNS-139]
MEPTEADEELPADVALLWGRRETGRRGPRPTLTAEDITRAATEIADAEGLAAVSMARVAAQLGNSTMALYRHVRSKDELLALMTDAALEYPPALSADAGWREGLTRWALLVLENARRHPWYSQLPIGGPPIGPRNLAWFDAALRTLAGTGLSEPDKVGVVMGMLTYVQGEIRLRAELSAGHAANPEAFGRRYSTLLRRLVDPRRMPALAAVVEAGVFDTDELYDEAEADTEFLYGFALYLDGVERLVARKGAG